MRSHPSPHRLLPCLLVTALSALLPGAARAQVVRVPQDVAGLAGAIGRVANGGVIELAAGRYPSPAQGFNFSNLGKAFTVRAVRGAQVVLDGGGSRPIVRLRNSQRSRGKRVTFSGLRFENAATTANVEGGAVSLAKGEARFVNCVFVNNTASGSSTGGGAVAVTDNSEASFLNSELRGNGSRNRGGALSVIASTVNVQGGSFVDNRVNIPGHGAGSVGGAIYVLNSVVRIDGTLFSGNEATFAGGALYAFGTWQAPETVPRADVLITRSTFLGNQGDPGSSAGGAIHVEDQATVQVRRSRFEGNEATRGGAIDVYRGILEVEGSTFRGNRAPLDAGGGGAGGAIFAASADFADSSTNNGAINRRPSRVTVTNTLLQGRFGNVGSTAREGGCLFAGGDINRAYGDGGVAQQGTLVANRAQVVLAGVIFSDCDAEGANPAASSFGGALVAELATLTVSRTLVLGSDVRGQGAQGGGFTIRRETAAVVTDTVFSGNTAEMAGGGVFLTGSDLQANRVSFFGNEVSPGVGESEPSSRGAALYTIPLAANQNPSRARGVAGLIANSLFSGNVGIAAFDVEGAGGPLNIVRYDANRFFERTFGRKVYVNTLTDRNGLEVGGLNALVVNRPGGPATDKSVVPNQDLGSAPASGLLLAVPPSGAPSSALPARLGFAWSGPNASINGPGLALPLSARFGVVEVATPGEYRLLVGGVQVAVAAAPAAACTEGPSLCLADGRFRVEVRWEDFQHQAGRGEGVPLTRDTGYFWFFNPANVELAVKVIDARDAAGNGDFWVFYGALSSVPYTLTVEDLATGLVRTYVNPSGNLGSIADTAAFPGRDPGTALAAGSAADLDLAADGVSPEEEFASQGLIDLGDLGLPEGSASGDGLSAVTDEAAEALKATCAPGPTTLCLAGGRFRIEGTWRDFQNRRGNGMAVPVTTDTGYFWFFSDQNVEVVVKVLDGRGSNGHFWVFYGALSSVEYNLTVTDMVTGRSKPYTNASGKLSSVADTSALPAN